MYSKQYFIWYPDTSKFVRKSSTFPRFPDGLRLLWIVSTFFLVFLQNTVFKFFYVSVAIFRHRTKSYFSYTACCITMRTEKWYRCGNTFSMDTFVTECTRYVNFSSPFSTHLRMLFKCEPLKEQYWGSLRTGLDSKLKSLSGHYMIPNVKSRYVNLMYVTPRYVKQR